MDGVLGGYEGLGLIYTVPSFCYAWWEKVDEWMDEWIILPMLKNLTSLFFFLFFFFFTCSYIHPET